MTFHVRSVDVVLYDTFLASLKETTFVLNLEEDLPSLLCQGIRQMLNVVRAGRGVNNTVEVALFLNQQLLVAGNALAEVRRLLIRSIEGCHHHRMNTTEGCTHGLCLRAKQVNVTIKQCLVIR